MIEDITACIDDRWWFAIEVGVVTVALIAALLVILWLDVRLREARADAEMLGRMVDAAQRQLADAARQITAAELHAMRSAADAATGERRS